jgi:hypothetical protein
VYKNLGWKGYPDWLTKEGKVRNLGGHMPFESARAFVHTLGLKVTKEWFQYARGKMPHKGKLPPGIPVKPDCKYANEGWAGMADWLGSGLVVPRLRKFKSFEDSRLFARRLRLKTLNEWRMYCAGKLAGTPLLPNDIPKHPHQVFQGKGFTNYSDWLGNQADKITGRGESR